MKIAFLCGSLELGKDGVGDYVRRLAGELMRRQGHSAMLIAINDRYTKSILQNTQADESTEIPALRLPSGLKWSERIKKASEFIEAFNPEWLSFQHSPYAYHSKGIPVRLPGHLKKIGNHCKWHIMIHEPFLRKENLNYKEAPIRQLQIFTLRDIKRVLRPTLWTASIPVYKQMVEQKLNVNCEILGLFGNIPFNKDRQETTVKSEGSNSEFITAVYFGTTPIERDWPAIFQKLQEQILQLPKSLHIIFCGKMYASAQLFVRHIETIVEAYKGKVTFKGELSAAEISKIFSFADFGISRVFPEFVGKSGCAIAMLEHGLPLWIPRAKTEDYKSNIDFRPELCFSNLRDLHLFESKKVIVNRLPVIASTFIKDIITNY